MLVTVHLLLLLAGSANASPTTCAERATIVEACREVHGRLQATNGNPSVRIWVVGTKRVLVVAGDEGAELLPDPLRKHVDFGSTVDGDFRVCPLTPSRPGEMQTVCVEAGRRLVVSKGDSQEKGDGGPLAAEDVVPALDAVVRYGIATARAPCVNYGAKDAFCLTVSGQDPPAALLNRLADVRPAVLSLSACLRQGIVASAPTTTDPGVDVMWLRAVADGRVQARIKVYCSVAEPVFRRDGATWTLVGSPGGWVGCGPVPGDCVSDFR